MGASPKLHPPCAAVQPLCAASRPPPPACLCCCLQSGVSRELFEAWCEDPRNCVIIADFAVQGTLARDILGNPAEVMTRNGVKVGLGGDPGGPVVGCFGGLLWLACHPHLQRSLLLLRRLQSSSSYAAG